MKNQKMLLIAMTVVFLAPNPAQTKPIRFLDDFNDAVFDPIWDFHQCPFAIEEAGGEVRIHGTTLESGWGTTNGISTGGYPFLEGDFTVSVDFRVPQFSGSGTRLIYLQAKGSSSETVGIFYSYGYFYRVQSWDPYQFSIGTLPPFGDEHTTFHTMKLTYDFATQTLKGYVDDIFVGYLNVQMGGDVGFTIGPATETAGMVVDTRFKNFNYVFDPALAWNPHPADLAKVNLEDSNNLTWSPGDFASSHNIYFGTNPILGPNEFKVNQASTAYNPGPLQWQTTYYWRIDEVNGMDTWEGRVWNFTTAYIVDDFESYDSNSSIDTAWDDGSVNNTGSEVFLEKKSVGSGKQSMKIDYNNVNLPYYGEVKRAFDSPQDWTTGGSKSLSLWFKGYPQYVGNFDYDDVNDIFTLTGSGSDIWEDSDEFYYACKSLSGPGQIVAKVLSVEYTSDWAKAGVMIRETLDPGSTHAMVVVTPINGVSFQRRPIGMCQSYHSTQGGINAPYWVKLVRDDSDNFTAYHSSDGGNWIALGSPVNIPMDPNVYIGLAVTSHDDKKACEAIFSDVNAMATGTGSVSGSWSHQNIGITSNEPAQMYVAIEDSLGHRCLVYHDDPNVTLINNWMEWNIDLLDFADVNLSDVNNITIGCGNSSVPQPGGSGTVYIDDIRLYPPRCFPAYGPIADFTGDCGVDLADVKIMSADWLSDSALNGLWYEYYEGIWEVLPNFGLMTPVKVGRVENFNIDVRDQEDYFGFRFTGMIDVPTTGDYTFYTTSDDGSKLYIGDTEVVANDGLHGMVTVSGTINLATGRHPIKVTMFEKTGGQGLQVEYQGPGITRQAIPNNVLFQLPYPYDLNEDGKVNFFDHANLAEMWLTVKMWPSEP